MALGELADVESMSQQDLGQLLGLEKSTVSRLAAGLQRRGWVGRERDPANRRFYQLQLTPEGRAVADRIGQDLRTHHEQLLGALTPDEREARLSASLDSPGRWPPNINAPASPPGTLEHPHARDRRPG